MGSDGGIRSGGHPLCLAWSGVLNQSCRAKPGIHESTSKCFKVDQKESINMSSPFSSYSSLMPEEFDIIVCGGGSCGCVVAGRSVSYTLSPLGGCY